MQPGINNDNFGSGNNSQYNSDHEVNNADNRTINERDVTSRKQDSEDENRANIVHDNKKVKDSWDAESKTFNEDTDNWEEKEAATSANNNSWNNNDHIIHASGPDYDEPYDIVAKDDYIDGDHSEYNRGNSRFTWNEPEEEEE